MELKNYLLVVLRLDYWLVMNKVDTHAGLCGVASQWDFKPVQVIRKCIHVYFSFDLHFGNPIL